MADLTFRREPRMGAWWDNKVTIYFNTDAQKLGFTSNCATCFLLLLQPITGEMELNQGSFWAFNRDVTEMCTACLSQMRLMHCRLWSRWLPSSSASAWRWRRYTRSSEWKLNADVMW